MSLDNLIKAKSEFEQQMKENGKKFIVEEVKSLFQRNLKLKRIAWSQYTPYFNDGDECIFRVGDIYGDLGTNSEINETISSELDSPYDLQDTWTIKKTEPELAEELDALGNKFSNVEDAFKLVFGDHVFVVIDRDGNITVKDYEHD